MARTAAWSPLMPGKTARALCPVCQEPMPPDETECDNCGAFVIDEAVVRLCRAFGIPREKALALFEKGFRHPTQLKDRNVDDVLQRGENGLLFLCTNCGGFVATGDPKCPRCGAEFEVETEAPAREKDILDTTLCPVCGADNDATWKECEICGEPLGGTDEPPGKPAIAASSAERASPSPPSTDLAPAASAKAHVPTPTTLDRIDNILKELDFALPPKTEPEARSVAKQIQSPKGARPAPETPRSTASAPPAASSREASGAPTGATIPPTASPRASASQRAPRIRQIRRPSHDTRRSREPNPTHVRPSTWRRREPNPPPSELAGGVTVAAAASLYLSFLLGQTYLAWGVSFIVTSLAAYLFAAFVSRRGAWLQRKDGLTLVAAGILPALAPGVPAGLSPVLSAAGAVLLAFATRRLLRTRTRHLLVVAADVPLVALALGTALGSAFAGSPAWVFALVALAPWPAAVAVEGARQRRAAHLLRQELARAQGHLEREQYAASVRDFDRAIALGRDGVPGQEVPWYGKGATLILLGQYDGALRAIDRALDLNPRNEVAWLNKGNALTKMGRLVDALRCYNAAIKVNPKFEVAWNNKGNTLARLGHFVEALTCYDRALDLDPGYRGAWINKGYVLTKLGRYGEATTCADRALHLDDRGAQGANRASEASTGVPSP